MWRTNLAVVLTVLGTLAVYTGVANVIPQVASEVPEEIELGADVTPEELAEAGEEVYQGAGGCTTCHGLGTRAPDLLGVIGTRCAERVPDIDCKEYLHQSLVDPTAFVVDGFQPIMPDMDRTLSDEEIWALVAFLQSQGGEITVTAADIETDEPEETEQRGAPADLPARGGEAAPAGAASGSEDPVALLRANQCLGCHRLGEEGAPLGPSFEDVAARLDADEIRRSILVPAADTAPGYEQVAGVMPPDFGSRLTAAQLEAIVQFLAERE